MSEVKVLHSRKIFFRLFFGQGSLEVENHSSKNQRNLQHLVHSNRKISKIFQRFLDWAEGNQRKILRKTVQNREKISENKKSKKFLDHRKKWLLCLKRWYKWQQSVTKQIDLPDRFIYLVALCFLNSQALFFD